MWQGPDAYSLWLLVGTPSAFGPEQGFAAFCLQVFLAHLSQRLKWAIVIAQRPSSVRPSVRRPSVNFHIFNFFSRTAWWILMKLGRYIVLMVPYKCCCFSDRSAQGWIQGRAKIGHGGPLLQESSSDRKATATNRMDSNDLEACGKKCCYFWFHSEVKFLTRFWRLFGLSHFCVFQCNFYRFLCRKELYLHLFCVISMFLRGRMLISKIWMLEEF